MGPCQGKAEGSGLNVAANQFPPVWGAVVKLGPNWGCWVGAELGVLGNGGQQWDNPQQVPVPGVVWAGESPQRVGTAACPGCLLHPGVLARGRVSPLCPRGSQQSLRRLPG